MRYSVINRPQGHYRPINFRDPQLTIYFPYIFVDIYTHKHHHSTHYSQTSKTQPSLVEQFLAIFATRKKMGRKFFVGGNWKCVSPRFLKSDCAYCLLPPISFSICFSIYFSFSGRFSVISWSLHADLLILFGFQCLHNLLSS